jgi:hypothetical protein
MYRNPSWRTPASLLALAASLLWASEAAAQLNFVGPTPYLSAGDIPPGFYSGGLPSALEDFEDCSLDFELVASAGVAISNSSGDGCTGFTGLVDSVDADDGLIDGSGSTGRSWFHGSGATGITFTFPFPVAAAGVVWTDGQGTTTFEAFGPGMVSLGTIGPVLLEDGQITGTTGEDRFFGVQDSSGIVAISLKNTAGGIEVDHVQYGEPIGALPQQWGEAFAFQPTGGIELPAVLVSFNPQPEPPGPATLDMSDSFHPVISHSGYPPDPFIQLDLASYGPLMHAYPPDPVHVGNRIEFALSDGMGQNFTLAVTLTSTGGEVIDPASLVGFNPQPEPPDPGIYGFNPQPEPPEPHTFSVMMSLMGGNNPPGGSTISLELEILDDMAMPVSLELEAPEAPALGGFGLAGLVAGLAGVGIIAVGRYARRSG